MQAELVIAVIEALEAESIPYFLAGSIASMVYGIPRATKDVDFVVEIGGDGIDRLARRLAGQFEFDPQQHVETSTWTRRTSCDPRARCSRWSCSSRARTPIISNSGHAGACCTIRSWAAMHGCPRLRMW